MRRYPPTVAAVAPRPKNKSQQAGDQPRRSSEMLRLHLLLNASRSVHVYRGDHATGDVTGSLDRHLLYALPSVSLCIGSVSRGAGINRIVCRACPSIHGVRARFIVVDLACSAAVSSIRGIIGGILLFIISSATGGADDS